MLLNFLAFRGSDVFNSLFPWAFDRRKWGGGYIVLFPWIELTSLNACLVCFILINKELVVRRKLLIRGRIEVFGIPRTFIVYTRGYIFVNLSWLLSFKEIGVGVFRDVLLIALFVRILRLLLGVVIDRKTQVSH